MRSRTVNAKRGSLDIFIHGFYQPVSTVDPRRMTFMMVPRSRFLSGLLFFSLVLGLGCSDTQKSQPVVTAPPSTKEEVKAKTPIAKYATIVVRSFGDIRIEFLGDVAPKTVANFQELAQASFYNGTTFHRIIPGFMIQGGDPNTRNDDPLDDGMGGPGYTIAAEFSDVPHARGILSMARSADPNSAGSQFFIVTHDAPHLNGQYTVFAKVVSGMEIVDRISEVETDRGGEYGPPDRPIEDVVIEQVRIEQE
jgi:cyclophilin family peptidyl-prolyl cis-trans isomerase